MWADHAAFCDEFNGLLSQACLLQGMSSDGSRLLINDMTFHVTTPSYPSSGTAVTRTIVVKLFDGEPSTVRITRGVRPVLTDHGLRIEDLWLDHDHLVVEEKRKIAIGTGTMTINPMPLNASKPWKARGRDDYLGSREYDMLCADLARGLRPQLTEAARLRVERKKEQLRIAREAEAEAQREILESIVVTREDLGEANDSWGMF